MGLLGKVMAFNNFVELTTVNRWLTASIMGAFYLYDIYRFVPNLLRLFVAFSGLMLVLWYVMAINDCFDVEEDRLKGRLSEKKLVVSVEISVRQALLASVTMLILGMFLSFLVSFLFFLVVILIVLLSTFYSVPPIRYKERFPFSTIGEFTGSLLLFLSGFSIEGLIDTRAVILSLVFALVTMYWRFVHETRFVEVDRQSGKTTFAVVFSPKTAESLAKTCLVLLALEVFILLGLGWFSLKFSILLFLYLFFAFGYWYRFITHAPASMKNAVGPLWGAVFVPIVVILWLV